MTSCIFLGCLLKCKIKEINFKTDTELPTCCTRGLKKTGSTCKIQYPFLQRWDGCYTPAACRKEVKKQRGLEVKL